MTSEARNVKKLFADLKSAKKKTFPKKKCLVDAPQKKGVYLIFDPKKRIVHVGAAPRGKKGIAQRLRNHLRTQSSFTQNFAPLGKKGNRLRNGYTFSSLVVENPRLLVLLEAYAIGSLCPLHIGTHLNIKRSKNPSKERRKK